MLRGSRAAMRVTVELIQARKTESLELPQGATGLDLLGRLGLHPDAQLLVRGDRPIPVDEPLHDREHLSILTVGSGG